MLSPAEPLPSELRALAARFFALLTAPATSPSPLADRPPPPRPTPAPETGR
jgi:hypothetical protein